MKMKQKMIFVGTHARPQTKTKNTKSKKYRLIRYHHHFFFLSLVSFLRAFTFVVCFFVCNFQMDVLTQT